MDRSYYLYFFSPETWKVFSEKGFNTGGVRQRQRNILKDKLKEGDYLIAYCSKFSRFLGILEFKGNVREELDNPYFEKEEDPFVWRFNVKKINFVDFKEPEKSIPLKEMLGEVGLIDRFKRDNEIEGSTDGQILTRAFNSYFGQGSLRKIEGEISEKIMKMFDEGKEFPLSEDDEKKLTSTNIEEEIVAEEGVDETSVSEKDGSDTHHKMQANLVEVAEKWGYKVWVPNGDKERVKKLGNFNEDVLLDNLPMPYHEQVLKIIKNIDIIWTKERSMTHAFEVENTTGVTSGLVRLNDLNALLPNIDTKFIVVSSVGLYKKFDKEIKRPTFEKIVNETKFLSYESLINLMKNSDINFMDERKLDDILDLPSE